MSRNAEIVRGRYAPRFRVWGAEVLDRMYEHAWHPDVECRAIEGAPEEVGVMRGRA